MNLDKCILVWEFCDAPKEFQDLSRNGGDEDWLAFIPHSGPGRPLWIDGSAFGCSGVEDHEVDGGTVYIGSHA